MKLNIDDEQGIEFLHFIFEREFKPPFRKVEKEYVYAACPYYNRDGEKIGMLDSQMNFYISFIIYENIKYKICKVFEFSYDTIIWWFQIKFYLKLWLENQINVKLSKVDYET